VTAAGSSPPSGRRAEPLDRRHIERRQLTARRLLPAVERLLEHSRYAEISVEQLVGEADISRSTFYNYFEDKSDLLRALTADVMAAITDASRVWWMLNPDASREQLRDALGHLFGMYSPHAAMMEAVSDSMAHDPRVREEFTAFMVRGAQGVANYIREGQRAGVFRAGIEPELAAAWLTWMFERGLSKLGRSAEEHDPESVVTALTDLLWKALR
jgi:AcrR family transcriptional regulator